MSSAADALTLSRAAVSVPVALALASFLEGGSILPFLALYAFAWATDVMDGTVARAKGACTERGAKMDVAADLLASVLSSAVLAIYGQLHPAYVALMAVQFAVFFGFSRVHMEYDRCGRIAGWLFCAVPLLAALLQGGAWDVLSLLLQPAICAMAVFSMVRRIRAASSRGLR